MLPKSPTFRSPWLRAFHFLKPLEPKYGHEPGFKFLLRLADGKTVKKRKVTLAPKHLAIPKKMLPQAQKKALKEELEAICKAIVRLRPKSQ